MWCISSLVFFAPHTKPLSDSNVTNVPFFFRRTGVGSEDDPCLLSLLLNELPMPAFPSHDPLLTVRPLSPPPYDLMTFTNKLFTSSSF